MKDKIKMKKQLSLVRHSTTGSIPNKFSIQFRFSNQKLLQWKYGDEFGSTVN